MKIATITPTELFNLITKGENPEILDVRTPAEYDKVRISPSANVPLDRLNVNQYLRDRKRSLAQPIYVLCKGGTRARMACEQFIQAGFDNVVLIEGGIMQWEACGLPVERSVPNVENQVRLTVGVMNLLGVLLGAFVNPYFLLISAFVSCGLIFAGITGNCPLAALIAAMPWNRMSAPACCSTSR